MTRVGLIGYGKWGKILCNKLKNICDLKFICTSKDDYEPFIMYVFDVVEKSQFRTLKESEEKTPCKEELLNYLKI